MAKMTFLGIITPVFGVTKSLRNYFYLLILIEMLTFN